MNQSYLVLARKYRPQNFNELIGQEVLVTTLTNAIKNDRLHHAYILTGIRGVGKTTTARIIAKTINCLDENRPQKEIACDSCDNCRLISSSKHQDVIEIDAASRTGVDDIREIIDSIAYAPVLAKYKIYIIDEVHMLSNNAFNALLKTLEEPPSHVKFIFATTEIRKVPVTILSRCQRFDLRRVDKQEISNHLKQVLSKEGFDIEEQGLMLISKMSEGSVRDSLSLLDQALAINNNQKNISTKSIEKMLGISSKMITLEIFEHLLNGNFIGSFNKFLEFYQLSSDINYLVNDLLEITHKITILKLTNNHLSDEYSKEQQDKIIEISNKTSLDSLNKIWHIISKGAVEINHSSSQKMSFEMLLARICHLQSLPNLRQILENLNENKNYIEKQEDGNINDDVDCLLKTFEGSKLI